MTKEQLEKLIKEAVAKQLHEDFVRRPGITVGELQKILSKFPPDSPVAVVNDGDVVEVVRVEPEKLRRTNQENEKWQMSRDWGLAGKGEEKIVIVMYDY